jgi:succinate dehydrogenase / fumarate reductase cytochrome b subunit
MIRINPQIGIAAAHQICDCYRSSRCACDTDWRGRDWCRTRRLPPRDNDQNRKVMMITTQKRPLFLNLLVIRLPVAGVMSIGHRISGVAMVATLPYFAYLLSLSVAGPAGFAAAVELVSGWAFKFFLFLFLWALMHHFLAGIRYLLLDIDIGVDKPVYRQTAWAVLAGGPVLALLLLGALS